MKRRGTFDKPHGSVVAAVESARQAVEVLVPKALVVAVLTQIKEVRLAPGLDMVVGDSAQLPQHCVAVRVAEVESVVAAGITIVEGIERPQDPNQLACAVGAQELLDNFG